MTDGERLEWLRAYCEQEEPEPGVPGNDPVLAAAVRLGDEYGWWYDPVLAPETVLDMVNIVLGVEAEARDDG